VKAVALAAAAAISFAPLAFASPAYADPNQPCATVDGTYTQACHDCMNSLKDDNSGHAPEHIVCKCGYPGTVGELQNQPKPSWCP